MGNRAKAAQIPIGSTSIPELVGLLWKSNKEDGYTDQMRIFLPSPLTTSCYNKTGSKRSHAHSILRVIALRAFLHADLDEYVRRSWVRYVELLTLHTLWAARSAPRPVRLDQRNVSMTLAYLPCSLFIPVDSLSSLL